jgi:hypothetical protein
MPDPRRRARLCFTLLCLLMPATEPELRMLHRCFDSQNGTRQIVAGLERQGLRLTLTHVGPGEWRATLMGENPMLAPKGYGVAPQPWTAVQQAGYSALQTIEREERS